MGLKQDFVEFDAKLGSGFGLLALLLYTHKDAAVVQCISDSTCWQAFGSISGDKIVLVIPRSIRTIGIFDAKPGLPDDLMEMVVAVDRPPEESLDLLDWLGISGAGRLPCLAFFVIDREADKVHVATVSVAAADKDKTFKAIEKPLRTAASTIAAYHHEATLDRTKDAVAALEGHFRFMAVINGVQRFADQVGKWRGASGA